MALARSASGPGGLNINTSSANSVFGGSSTTPAAGMFGSAQKPATGLFGSTTSAPQAGGMFGSSTQAGGGLFGSSTTTSTPQSGGLFASTPAAQPQSGGLFGNNTSQQAQTGGLFGSSLGTNQSSQAQQSGGLFSQSTTQNTGGLFGAGVSQPAQSGGGMFSGLNNQNQNQTSGGLFGNTQNQQSQPTAFPSLGQNQQNQSNQGPTLGQNQGQGMFGSTLGGGLSLGQNNQQQTVPGVKIDMTNIRGTTRFTDLHESIQKEIESIDAVIQSQIQLKNDCDAIIPAHDTQLAQVPNDVEFCRRKLIGVQHAGASDVYSIDLVKKYIDTDVQNAKLSFKAIDNLKLPPQYHNPGIWSAKASSSNQTNNGEGSNAQDMVNFFSSTADELGSTLSNYQKHIVDIEQHLRGVEGNSASQLNMLISKKNGNFSGADDPYEQLTGALRDFEESLLGVAGNVGSAREGMQSLQLGRFPSAANGAKGPRSGVY